MILGRCYSTGILACHLRGIILNFMSRLIKFRIWCKGTSPNPNFRKPGYYSLNNSLFRKYFPSFPDLGDEQEHFIIEQFTGFKFEGKEVYEGDVLKFTQCLFNTNPDDYPVRIKQVMWNDLLDQWTIYESRAGEIDLSVIGNIHENHELLKWKPYPDLSDFLFAN